MSGSHTVAVFCVFQPFPERRPFEEDEMTTMDVPSSIID